MALRSVSISLMALTTRREGVGRCPAVEAGRSLNEKRMNKSREERRREEEMNATLATFSSQAMQTGFS